MSTLSQMKSTARLLRLAAVLVALVASFALVACGGDDDDEEEDTQAIEETVTGYGASEGAEACEFLSSSALDQLGGESGCTQTFEPVGSAELAVEEVLIDGGTATVQAENTEEGGGPLELELVEEEGEWKISAFPGLETIAPPADGAAPGDETAPEDEGDDETTPDGEETTEDETAPEE